MPRRRPASTGADRRSHRRGGSARATTARQWTARVRAHAPRTVCPRPSANIGSAHARAAPVASELGGSVARREAQRKRDQQEGARRRHLPRRWLRRSGGAVRSALAGSGSRCAAVAVWRGRCGSLAPAHVAPARTKRSHTILNTCHDRSHHAPQPRISRSAPAVTTRWLRLRSVPGAARAGHAPPVA